AAGQAVLLNLLASALIGILIVFLGDDFLRLLGAEPEVVAQGQIFLNYLMTAVLMVGLLMASNVIMKAHGNTRTPMLIMLFINILNIILDYALIFGKLGFPEYGLHGSAIASAVVNGLGGIVAFAGLLLGWYKIPLSLKDIFVIDKEILGKILRISGPSMAESALASGAYAVFTGIVASLGTLEIAVNSVLLRAESLSYMPGVGMSVAARIIIGQALGENNEEKASIAGIEACKLGLLVMGFAGMLFFFFSEQIIGAFTTSEPVITMGARILKVAGVVQPIQAVMFVLMGGLQGAGDTRTTMLISLAGFWMVRLPLAYLFGVYLGFGLMGAWGAMYIDVTIRALWSYFRFAGKKWVDIEI
ncbi:MAG: MATE family efflux transporter, partial [Vulcanimicrobiota bacterium]